eukprot:CAMPEP_0176003118 /NCGR_PEP_ID=MMETSP0120_2-20121206/1005_1 /TAXON_ID=160619 /ORGANISM="Kryptoperidinium foliaceum, Strain CCMP 1326" /LENGTH=226 /DNA_ID=CAMNT_0017335743 /DNA_START=165 /DNA_END=842 /DNA_ORIENTATION=+
MTIRSSFSLSPLLFIGFIILLAIQSSQVCGFSASSKPVDVRTWLDSPSEDSAPRISTIDDASLLLQEWDKFFNTETAGQPLITTPQVSANLRAYVPEAVRLLSEAATEERNKDSTMGRCMLGICASSLEEGIATLKAWVTTLQLPRGLLHGADKDGVQLQLEGGVYIKYNSGGVYTFADIRKSGLGFDALWKPGDALLEPYDGTYRGVYFQVELSDGDFRQYLVPL